MSKPKLVSWVTAGEEFFLSVPGSSKEASKGWKEEPPWTTLKGGSTTWPHILLTEVIL